MRRLFAEGVRRYILARLFGISQESVHYIVSGKTWRPDSMRTA